MNLISVHSSDSLNVQITPGTGDTLVISFAGVGTRRHQCPPPEFVKIASDEGRNTVLFISDISRSWLNAPKLVGKIRRLVAWAEERFQTKRTVAIGNSMGGTMAILMARHCTFETVTALVPQVSVHPSIVPEETRWQFFTQKIERFSYPSIEEMEAPGTQYFILHGDTESELIHARRFPEVGSGFHMVMANHGHKLAAELREEGVLAELMHLMMQGDESEALLRLEDLGGTPVEYFRTT